jgi:hypothetical protein
VAKAAKKPVSIGIGVWVMLTLVLLSIAAFWYFQSVSATKARLLELTPEAKEYVSNLRLSEVGMKATESYLKQMVVEIDGKITNAGKRPLEQVELVCVFYDSIGQVVLRKRVAIVSERGGGLKPLETKRFRLPFDDLPESWNHQSPQLVIAGIRFTL